MLPLADGRPILAHVVERAVAAFGAHHVVVATTTDPSNEPIARWCAENNVECVSWHGDEADVLDRFHHVAHTYRWHPDSVIVRVTADEPFQEPEAMRRVAVGERLPVEVGAEAFTLAMLDAAGAHPLDIAGREHITDALFPFRASSPTDGRVYSVDTPDDYARAVERSKTAARR